MMKYIIIEYTQGGQTRHMPFIFPNAIVHADMYETMTYAIREETIKNKRDNNGQYAHDFKCLGAGELSSMRIGNGCVGGSETLGVKSREGVDDNAIKMFDYTHGHSLVDF